MWYICTVSTPISHTMRKAQVLELSSLANKLRVLEYSCIQIENLSGSWCIVSWVFPSSLNTFYSCTPVLIPLFSSVLLHSKLIDDNFINEVCMMIRISKHQFFGISAIYSLCTLTLDKAIKCWILLYDKLTLTPLSYHPIKRIDKSSYTQLIGVL